MYYDLAEAAPADVAIVRIEQLYPVPEAELRAVFDRSPEADLVWCQEEPENMGAWGFLRDRLRRLSGREPRFVGRTASASPATGSSARHQVEQERLVADALGD